MKMNFKRKPGYKSLACAIIEQAFIDLKRKNERQITDDEKESAISFFSSPLFFSLTDFLDVDADKIVSTVNVDVEKVEKTTCKNIEISI